MTKQTIENLETIYQSVEVELHDEDEKLVNYTKSKDDCQRSVDQLSAMALNLKLTIKIMKSREGPVPVTEDILIPEY